MLEKFLYSFNVFENLKEAVIFLECMTCEVYLCWHRNTIDILVIKIKTVSLFFLIIFMVSKYIFCLIIPSKQSKNSSCIALPLEVGPMDFRKMSVARRVKMSTTLWCMPEIFHIILYVEDCKGVCSFNALCFMSRYETCISWIV